jgi:hypothetical protein
MKTRIAVPMASAVNFWLRVGDIVEYLLSGFGSVSSPS